MTRALVLFASLATLALAQPAGAKFDVRAYGAKGDGRTLDSAAINRAIDTAAAAGGGTVYFGGGTYLSVTLRLKSNITLYLDSGATLLAADPKDGARYDAPEPNESDQFQDFGHTHFRNSLIWGENLENVAILGAGWIDGKGLVRSGSQARSRDEQNAVKGKAPAGRTRGKFSYPDAGDAVPDGWGNKTIALKLCRNVIIRDVTIRKGGHFGILATGVDNLTIDNVKMDVHRDGMDIDACRNVRIANCAVNSPWDDGICLKATLALGFPRACENVTITNCQCTGYDEGTFLDGTYQRKEKERYSHKTTTGRMKFGTESNGGFKNITISNCVFDYVRGLALETVDGGPIEDVTITNVTMRDVVNAPIYLRLGSRLRAPEGTPPGALRRVTISNVTIHNATREQGILIVGVPGNPIEDVTLSHIFADFEGGGTAEMAARDVPDDDKAQRDYPEPANHGALPAWGLFARHVKNLTLDHVELRAAAPDARPAIILDDVAGAALGAVKGGRVVTKP